jgi:acyl carrier protein
MIMAAIRLKFRVTHWSQWAPSWPLTAKEYQARGTVSDDQGEATMNNIEDCLKDILTDDLFVEIQRNQILPSYSFRQDLGIDSVGFVELKEQVEKRFNIAISDDDFTPENFSTISSLTSLIHRYCSLNCCTPQ